MPELIFAGQAISAEPGETVLSALERAGVVVETSCRAGVCQSCLMKVVEGQPPAKAQAGLSAAAKAQGLFTPCVCIPEGPMTIARADEARQRVLAEVQEVLALSSDIVRLRVRPAAAFSAQAGQFLNLIGDDGLVRSYSIAQANEDDLDLHVRVYDGGRMSPRLAQARPGDTLTLTGPQGGCVYAGVEPEQPLLLAGTGTGLAPLWGVLNDALASGHTGPIELIHGARTAQGLYLIDELFALQSAHPNFTYRTAVLDQGQDIVAETKKTGMRLVQAAVFVCGDADIVAQLKRQLFLAGGRLDQIRADAFLPAAA